jgi:hypothetical protein
MFFFTKVRWGRKLSLLNFLLILGKRPTITIQRVDRYKFIIHVLLVNLITDSDALRNPFVAVKNQQVYSHRDPLKLLEILNENKFEARYAVIEFIKER